MRKIISTLLIFGAMLLSAQAQIVITEISYNDPSSGADNFEFIELYNNSAASVDLSGWNFTQGVTHTFPSGISIGAGAYLVLCVDSVLMQSTFGVAAYQWTSGGLSNSGEDIILVDDMGNGIDTVDFDDFNPWPRIADGFGPSIVLCNVNGDNNDPANWSYSGTPTGVLHGDDSAMVFFSPGAANSNVTCSAAPSIFFNGLRAQVSESAGSIDIELIMANTGAADTAGVDITVAGGTASAGTDYNYTTSSPQFGPQGVGGITFVTVTIPIVNDMMAEGNETLILTMGSPTMGATIAPTGDFIITILDDDVPLPRYPIGLISEDSNGDGDADSLGIRCEIQGIVHGVDLQGGNSVQFTVIDSTGGTGVFSSNPFGYTVTEGDEVLIPGLFDHFNGLAQMTPDTIILISTGNAIVTPLSVTTLDETTESEVVQFDCVTILDTNDWPTTVSSRNVDVSNGVDTFVVRIDSDVNLAGTPVPASKWLRIAGIGGQFDSSVPRNSGYQLLPRYMADVVELGNPAVSFATANDTVGEAGATISVGVDITNGNPDSTSVTVSLAAASSTATEGADFSFSDVTLHFNGCGAGAASFDVTITDDMDVELDETIVLVISTVTNGAEVSIDTVTIVITDNDMSDIGKELNASAIKFYPNPATSKLSIEASLPVESLQVLNLVGQEVMRVAQPSQKTELQVGNLPAGTYFLRAQTAEGVWIARWVKL